MAPILDDNDNDTELNSGNVAVQEIDLLCSSLSKQTKACFWWLKWEENM